MSDNIISRTCNCGEKIGKLEKENKKLVTLLNAWMEECDRLKEKYEPKIIVTSKVEGKKNEY